MVNVKYLGISEEIKVSICEISKVLSSVVKAMTNVKVRCTQANKQLQKINTPVILDTWAIKKMIFKKFKQLPNERSLCLSAFLESQQHKLVVFSSGNNTETLHQSFKP